MRQLPATLRFALFLPVIVASGCLHATTSFTPASGVVVADTSADARALLLAAWEDQIQFERFRLENLPRYWSPHRLTRHPCDELIGRFCLSADDAWGTWNYIPETEKIAIYRNDLVEALRAVGRRVPGDDWVMGQWVRYAVEAGLYPVAAEGALLCAGTDWWCAALAGYTFHKSGRAAEAEKAFATALAAMPPSERSRWMDPLELLEPSLADSLRALTEAERHRLVTRFWRLADPFLSRPGNEVFSEHLARRVEIQFQYAAGFLEGLPWEEDLDELQLRYGTPWSRIAGMGISASAPPFGVPDLISNYRMPGVELLPPIDGLQVARGKWDEVNRVPRAGYSISLDGAPVTWIPPLAHQVAVFRRNDTAVVVAAFDPAAHDLADVNMEAGFAFLPWDALDSEPVAARLEGSAQPKALMVPLDPRSGLLSLEVFIPEKQAVARFRRPLDIQPYRREDPGISDLLLVQADVRPDSLEHAVSVARGSDRVRPGDVVGIFWENYGIDADAYPVISISLRLIPARPSTLQRLGQIFGLVPPSAPTEVRWQEETSPGSVMPRSVALTIPELPGGTHTLELTVHVGEEELVSRKEIIMGPVLVPDLPRGEVTRRPVLRRALCADVHNGTDIEVGNEENRRISDQLRELEAFREYWRQSWEFPPVNVPQGWSCLDWVAINREYYGHGPQPK